MEIHTRRDSNFFSIQLNGELDASSAVSLDAVMAEAITYRPKQIMIDCEKLRYISSAGLGMFLSYILKLESENIQLVLYSMPANVKDIFNMIDLDALIPILPSEKAAHTFCKRRNMFVNITSNGNRLR